MRQKLPITMGVRPATGGADTTIKFRIFLRHQQSIFTVLQQAARQGLTYMLISGYEMGGRLLR